MILAGISDDRRGLDTNSAEASFALEERPLNRQTHALRLPRTRELKDILQVSTIEDRRGGWRPAPERRQSRVPRPDKLDRWSDDLKVGLEQEIRDLDREIKELRRSAHGLASLAEKLAIQAKARETEALRTRKRKELFEAQDKLDSQRDELIASVQKNSGQRCSSERLFTIRWSLI